MHAIPPSTAGHTTGQAHPASWPDGGALYHLALNDIFWNFMTQEDLDHLRRILLAVLAERGTTRYAIAFAWKRAATAPEAGAAETPPKSIGQRLKSFLGV